MNSTPESHFLFVGREFDLDLLHGGLLVGSLCVACSAMVVGSPCVAFPSLGNVDVAPTFLELAGWRSATGAKIPPQMDGRSFAAQLMGTAATAATAHSDSDIASESGAQSQPRPNRTEFLIEFTGLHGWPNNEKPQGQCPSGVCARLNDCPNNTYRALRIVSETNYMPGLGKNLLLTEFTSAPDWHYETPNFWSLFGASVPVTCSVTMHQFLFMLALALQL